MVYSVHNWPFHNLLTLPLKYFYLGLERIASGWCDAIAVDTRAVKRYGLQFNVAPSEKIHQIYMGFLRVNDDHCLY